MEIWRVPSATHVPSIRQSQNKVLGIRVSVSLFFWNPFLFLAVDRILLNLDHRQMAGSLEHNNSASGAMNSEHVVKFVMTTNKMQLFWLIYLFLVSCTYFRWRLRPSSGALDCIYSFWYWPPVLLPAGIMDEMEQFHLIHDTSRQQYRWTISDAVNTVKCSWWWAKTSPEICVIPRRTGARRGHGKPVSLIMALL